ncbi:28S ribosomal protein S18c, mitochondrial [Hylaeus anthracinus]|uniref:28S ribosomal protein S18c, mitochondrial n=1 Tax=Hylaeus anthracinus TaxID=313031 RepID=UPI0023BA3683|nr:28S ribosomal protein S18c, mitochondrial [Hylaeus anthracinus]
MIRTFVTAQTLRNVSNRVPMFPYRNKSSEAFTSNTETINVTPDPDLPTISENPFKKERKVCILCKHKIEPNFKNVRLLSQFQSRYTGRIYGKHITGLCEYKQKRMEEEILKAQTAGLMGIMTRDPKYANDPKLFDPNFPFKPHPF